MTDMMEVEFIEGDRVGRDDLAIAGPSFYQTRSLPVRPATSRNRCRATRRDLYPEVLIGAVPALAWTCRISGSKVAKHETNRIEA